MDITLDITLSPIQQLKWAVAAQVDYDFDKAQKFFDFLTAEAIEGVSSATTNSNRPDGIYYVLNNGSLITYAEQEQLTDRNKVVGVAVKMADKIATVALHDAADGEEIALCTDCCGSSQFFHQDFFNAITDWDGEANTKDMMDKLNPEIGLQEHQYIPSLAQMHLILLNIKEVNRALELAGGDPLKQECYWTSTEYSSNDSWYVGFYGGNSFSSGGKFGTLVVRPAVACQP